MSTYVISDIHGHFEEFMKLLEAVNFKFDGYDSLYVLGDLCDWGPDSLKVLLWVKKNCEKHDFIHFCPGNHDYMISDSLKEDGNFVSGFDFFFLNWMENRGESTYNQLLSLSKEERLEIKKWIENSPHQYTGVYEFGFYWDLTHSVITNSQSLMDWRMETWNRCPWSCVPPKSRIDAWSVHGHTITTKYNIIEDIVSDKNLIAVNPENRRIDIDCGGKVINLMEEARLAMLDISNFSVIYSDTLKFEPIYLV